MSSLWTRATAWIRTDPWLTPHGTGGPAATPAHRTLVVATEPRLEEIQ